MSVREGMGRGSAVRVQATGWRASDRTTLRPCHPRVGAGTKGWPATGDTLAIDNQDPLPRRGRPCGGQGQAAEVQAAQGPAAGVRPAIPVARPEGRERWPSRSHRRRGRPRCRARRGSGSLLGPWSGSGLRRPGGAARDWARGRRGGEGGRKRERRARDGGRRSPGEGRHVRSVLWLHRRSKAAATILTTLVDDPTGYGRVVREGSSFRAIVEESDASAETASINEISTLVYAFRREELYRALPLVGRENRQREYYLPDMLGILRDKGERVSAVLGDFGRGAGVNSRASIATVSRLMRDRINARHLDKGVTIVDPARPTSTSTFASAPTPSSIPSRSWRARRESARAARSARARGSWTPGSRTGPR